MLRKKFYSKLEPIIQSAVKALHEKNITPMQLTYAGAAMSLLTGVIFAKGYIFIGGILMALAGLGDMLDGPLARFSGKDSKLGAFLDSTIDRYSDFFIYAGLAVHFMHAREPFWAVTTLAVLLGAFVISYTKARGENFISDCSLGVFTRETRFVFTLVGALTVFLLKPVLLVLAVGCQITALRRIFAVKQALEPAEEKSSEESSDI